jgi:type III secretion protein V
MSPAATRRSGRAPYVPIVVPWSFDVSSDLERLLEDVRLPDGATRSGLHALGPEICDEIFHDLGLPAPLPRVGTNARLPARHVVLSLREIPAKTLRFDAPTETEKGDAEILAEVRAAAATLVRGRAADFLGIAETQRLVDELQQVAPATVTSVVGKTVPIVLLKDVLQRLVEEGVSIRDLRAILENLAQNVGVDKDPLRLAECVRGALRRQIGYQLTRGETVLSVIALDPLIEDQIQKSIHRTSSGAYLALAPATQREILEGFRQAFEKAGAQLATDAHGPRAGGRPIESGTRPLVVWVKDDFVRRFVHQLVQSAFPDVAVVSVQQMLPDIAIRPLAVVAPRG